MTSKVEGRLGDNIWRFLGVEVLVRGAEYGGCGDERVDWRTEVGTGSKAEYIVQTLWP